MNILALPVAPLNTLCVVIVFQCLMKSIALKIIDNYVNSELYLGLESVYRNGSIRNCTWRRMTDVCSQDVSIILYVDNKREVYDPSDQNWLRKSSWNTNKDTVLVIHGYAAGDQDVPITVLKKAYATHGGYNVLLVDYSTLGHPPCYVSNVNNVPYISQCVGRYLNQLRNSGLSVEKLTCVGHSLGTAKLIRSKNDIDIDIKFQALDPALPLIFGNFRLKRSSANFVHVLQTNAGHFGDVGSIGHVNVCVNGGLIQPYCHKTSNPNLCSHIWAICYMSQSLFENLPLVAKKCSIFCPNAGLFKFFRSNSLGTNSDEIQVINNVPLMATGTYCLQNNNPPYCPKFLNGTGDELCCKFA